MKNIEKISEELFDKIRSRFDHVVLGDRDTQETDNPSEARFFNFDYLSQDGKNYGNITLSLIDENGLKIYFSTNLSDKLAENEANQQEWYNFLKDLRYFAKRNLLTFDTRDINRSNLTIRDLKSVSNSKSTYNTSDTPVIESRMQGTSRVSIQEFGPVRLVIRHSEAINEEVPGSRSRKIDSMFIETNKGERFLMPFKKLSAGRAMAEHLAHGGLIHDDVSKHIVGIVEEMSNLSFFVRGTRNRVFEDSETQEMVETAVRRYQSLSTDLKRLGKSRGYEHFAETFQPAAPIEEDFDLESLRERFVKKVFDDRLSTALPYVHRAYQQYQTEEQNQYFKEFGNWVDTITEQGSEVDVDGLNTVLEKPLAVGLDGIDALNTIKDFVSDDTLFNEITKLGQNSGTEADARPLIHQWMLDNGYQSNYSPEETSIDPTEPESEIATLESIKRLAGI